MPVEIVVLAAALVFAACGSLDGGLTSQLFCLTHSRLPADATVAVPSSGRRRRRITPPRCPKTKRR